MVQRKARTSPGQIWTEASFLKEIILPHFPDFGRLDKSMQTG
jgi:hypothetical protein